MSENPPQDADTVLDCECGHAIEEHTSTPDYWSGDGDSPCVRCECEDYDGEGYPTQYDGLEQK